MTYPSGALSGWSSVPSILSLRLDVAVLTAVVNSTSNTAPGGSETVRVSAAGTAGDDLDAPDLVVADLAAVGFATGFDSGATGTAASGVVAPGVGVSCAVAGFSSGIVDEISDVRLLLTGRERRRQTKTSSSAPAMRIALISPPESGRAPPRATRAN